MKLEYDEISKLLERTDSQLSAIRFYAQRLLMYAEDKKATLRNPNETEIANLDRIRQKMAQVLDLWEATIETN